MSEDLKIPPMPEYHDEPVATGMDAEWRHICDLRKWGAAGWTEAQAQARRAEGAETELRRWHETDFTPGDVEFTESDGTKRKLVWDSGDDSVGMAAGYEVDDNEWDALAAERDALKARVAELENGSFAKRQGATLETYRIERNEARATLAQRDREVLALRSALEREHCSGVIPPDTCITRSNPTELRCPRCYALASTAQAGAGAERRVRQDERERCAIAIWHKDQDRRWTKGEIRAFMEPEADILGTEPNP